MRNTDETASANAFIFDYALSMVAYFVCGGAIIARLTEYFNTPLAVANAIVALPAILPITQIFGGYLFSNSHNRHRFLRAGNLLWRMLLPLVYFSVLLPSGIGAIVMSVTYALMLGSFHFIQPAHNAWLVDAVEGKVKNNYYSMRELAFMALHTVSLFLCGLLVDNGSKSGTLDRAFIMVGLFSTLLLGFSAFVMLRRLPPPMAAVQDTPKTSLWRSLTVPFSDRAYRPVLSYNVIWNIANMFASSFCAIYQIRILKLDYIFVVGWATAANLLRVVTLPMLAKLAERIGWKLTSQLTLAVMGLSGLSYIFLTKENAVWLFPFLIIFGQIPYGGFGIGFFKMQISCCRNKERSVYFAANAAACGVSSIIGTALCSALVGYLEGSAAAPSYSIVFIIGAVGTALTIMMVQKVPNSKDDGI